MATRSHRRFAGPRTGAAIAVLAIGLVATDSAGQVPLALLDEPAALNPPTDVSRATRPLSWRQKAQILTEAGVPVPARPPMEFALTPAAPARFPGGFIRMGAYGNTEWHASRPDVNSGRIMLRSARLNVVLSGLKANTRYLLDLSISGPASLTVYTSCNVRSSVAASFPYQSGQEHAFVVTPTTAAGEACVSFDTERGGYFYRVDISELGPTP